MIFATCGSSPAPFERMMKALAALPPDDLHVQHGPATPPPCAQADDFLPFGRMVELIESADVVVSHAGVGSIICALRAGHVPIVFPRLKRYAETVDDHQAELAEALEQRGNLIVVWTPEQLADAVASVPPRGEVPALDADKITAAVRSAIRREDPRPFIAAHEPWVLTQLSRFAARGRQLDRAPTSSPHGHVGTLASASPNAASLVARKVRGLARR